MSSQPARREGWLDLSAIADAGLSLHIDAVPVAAAAVGAALYSAWGDGCVRVFRRAQAPECVPVHRGAILALIGDGAGGVLSGGDDGLFARLDGNGMQALARLPGRWIDHVAASADGSRACAAGRQVYLWDADGDEHELAHPSGIGGMAFDHRGTRLAVAHYGGVTLWTRAGRKWQSHLLDCRGSHLAVTWSPDDRFVMSSMQESALHGWRVADRMPLHISGYPAKVKQWAWAGDRPWLVTSGAAPALLWPFDRSNGPMQRPPLALFEDDPAPVSAVCAVAGQETVLAGKADGSVLIANPAEPKRCGLLRHAGGAAVTLLAVLPDPDWLLAADADGGVLWAALHLP